MASCDAFYRFTLVDIGASGGNHDSVVFSLSGVRRTIEHTFGILANRWRILRRPLLCDLETCENIVQACVVLHNFVQRSDLEIPENERRYCPTGFAAKSRFGMRKTDLRSVRRVGSNNAKREYIELRNTLCEYVNSPKGSVPWQLEKVLRGCVPQGFMGMDNVDDMINM
ncbi:hypothetical protein JTB14_022345 [Gonioctena quinquepunctata]|nr:hypothetical protein JTB14_022345 [Gonioctena quinquepunctata]